MSLTDEHLFNQTDIIGLEQLTSLSEETDISAKHRFIGYPSNFR